MKKLLAPVLWLCASLALGQVILTRPMSDPNMPSGGNPPLGADPLFAGLVAAWSYDDLSHFGHDSFDSLNWVNVGSGPDSNAGVLNPGEAVRVRAGAGDGFSLTTTGLRMSQDFSVSFWFHQRPADAGTPFAGTTVLLRVTGDYEITTTNGDVSLTAKVFDSVAGSASTTQPCSTTYDHFVAVYDSTTKKVSFSVNAGVASASAALTNGLNAASTGATSMVSINDQTVTMDELYVWNRQISQAEIARLQTTTYPHP